MLRKLLFIIALFSIAPAMAMMQQIQQSDAGKKVKIQTQDNEIFELNIQHAMLFKTLYNLFKDVGIDTTIPVNINSKTWQLIEPQLHRIFKISVFDNNKEKRRRKICNELSKLDGQTLFDILHAANYLDNQELIQCASIASKHVDLLKVSPEQITLLPAAIRNPIVLQTTFIHLCPLLITSTAIDQREPYALSMHNMNSVECRPIEGMRKAIINNEKRTIEIWDIKTDILIAQSIEQEADIELIGRGPNGGSPIKLRTIDRNNVPKRWNIEVINTIISILTEKIKHINAEQTKNIWLLLQQVRQGSLERNEALSQIQMLLGIIKTPTWQKVALGTIGTTAIATFVWLTYKYFTDDSQ